MAATYRERDDGDGWLWRTYAMRLRRAVPGGWFSRVGDAEGGGGSCKRGMVVAEDDGEGMVGRQGERGRRLASGRQPFCGTATSGSLLFPPPLPPPPPPPPLPTPATSLSLFLSPCLHHRRFFLRDLLFSRSSFLLDIRILSYDSTSRPSFPPPGLCFSYSVIFLPVSLCYPSVRRILSNYQWSFGKSPRTLVDPFCPDAAARVVAAARWKRENRAIGASRERDGGD